MDGVQYKGFFIFVKVQHASGTRFQVVNQICRAPDETELVRNWMTIQKFVSPKAAYEFALQEACAWIDEEQ